MRTRLLLLTALCFFWGPAPALEKCTVGQKVTTPGGKVGTVTEVKGTACKVAQDGTGWTNVWGAFMLEPGPGQAEPAAVVPGAPAAGMYQCRGGPAGNFRIEFRGPGAYANDKGSAGAYSFDAAAAKLRFTSGPWEGFYGQVLKDGDVGLSSRADASFYGMNCERQR